MMKLLRTLLLFAVIPPLLASCSTFRSRDPVAIRSDSLRALLEEYFEEYLRLDPLFASSIGDHRYDSALEIPFEEEHLRKRTLLMERSLSRLAAIGCRDLAPSDLYTCLTFREELETDLNLMRADLDRYMPFNQFDSFFSSFAELASGSSYVTFETTADYRNFLARMRKVPQYLQATEAALRKGMEKKITVPRVLAERALKQLKDLLVSDPDESVFSKPVRKFPRAVSAREQEELRTAYEEAIRKLIYPSYRKLATFVEKEYLPSCRTGSGVSELPGGREYYRALVRHHTLTGMTPDQIMALGLSEVARIRKEMEAVRTELHYEGALPAFFQSLRTNPELYPFKKPEEVMAAYRRIQDTVAKRVTEHFRLMPKAPFEIREVEKFKAESASEAYQNPSADGTRPGIFWVPIPDPRKYEKKGMEALFLHEAIPGHHFQISLQQESELPRYRKFFGNNAYVEGWGLYAESLGRELGLYTDPYQWIGRLQYEMHRAIRLVVDVGIHWKGWSRERAIRYSLQQEPLDEAGIISEVERYMAIPGQALSYKIGELKLRELKALARERLGAGYSDGEFHDQILKEGPLPLSVLEGKIRDWLEQIGKANHS